jgi:hypothetical protein
VSTLQEPELHLDVSGQQKPVLLLSMSTAERPLLHLDKEMSTLQSSVLDVKVSSPKGPNVLLNIKPLPAQQAFPSDTNNDFLVTPEVSHASFNCVSF